MKCFVLLLLVLAVVQCTSFYSCNQVPELGTACIQLNLAQSNLNTVLNISSSIYLNVSDNVGSLNHQQIVCLSDEELLSLAQNTTSLQSYIAWVSDQIENYGYIPADEYSVCVKLQDLDFETGTLSGCVSLSTTLMCFTDSCLYKGIISFGCFNLN